MTLNDFEGHKDTVHVSNLYRRIDFCRAHYKLQKLHNPNAGKEMRILLLLLSLLLLGRIACTATDVTRSVVCVCVSVY